jgi:hypothetical protein
MKLNILIKLRILVKNPSAFFRQTFVSLKYTIWYKDNNTKKFIEHNVRMWSSWMNADSKSIILFDYFPISETEIARSYLLNVLAKKYDAKIVSYNHNNKVSNVWKNIYKSFNVSSHVDLCLSDEQKNKCAVLSKEIISKIQSKEDIFNLKIFGVWVGVDMYEEFLMRYTEPTIIVKDVRMLNIIREGIHALIFWKEYFENNDVKAIVSSHIGVRIEKNLPVKIAGKLFNIPFYSTHARNINHFSSPHLHHQEVANRYISYHDKFIDLSKNEQKQGILWGKERINKRLLGSVGVDMPYSTKSAFTADTVDNLTINSSKVKILVATHEFYDSPNCYGGLLFFDFYEWLIFLGDLSNQTDYEWYIKTHPDVLPITKKEIKVIVDKYPRFQLIPPETSFHQLSNEGVEYVLTCYGSIGHECPLLGMTVVNAGNNPHMGYDFNWNPKTLEEYENILMNLSSFKKKINFNDVYEFYYMHYKKVGIIDDWIFLSYKQLLLDLNESERANSTVFQYFLDSLSEDKHQKIILRMSEFVESGKKGLQSKP